MTDHKQAAREIMCGAEWLEANDLFSREIVLSAALARVERETRERCVQALVDEAVDGGVSDEDAAYNRGLADGIAAIRALSGGSK